MSAHGFKPGDWFCAECETHNFARRNACYLCGQQKKAEDAAKSIAIQEKKFAEAAAGVSQPVNAAPEIYCSIDIERIGPDFGYGILAIGVCVGWSDGTIIEQRAFCTQVPEKEGFEQVCWESFWCKHPDILVRIHQNAMANHVSAFHAWMLDLEKRHGPFGRKHAESGGVKFKLVTDNPGYDIGLINLEFFKLGHKRPVSEMFDDYVPTSDPSEQSRGLTPLQKKIMNSFMVTPHDHWPVNDATRTFEQMCGVKTALNFKE